MTHDLEKELEQWAKDFVESKGLRLEKLTGPKGWPDRMLFGPTLRGVVGFIEFKKSAADKLSPQQRYWMTYLNACDHPVLVAYTRAHVQKFVTELLNNN